MPRNHTSRKSGDFESDPDKMYENVQEEKYKPELEMFDRWQSFSAEILRLSLLGIAVFGFLYDKKHMGEEKMDGWLLTSVVCFALSAISALIYRYTATEGLMHLLRGLKDSALSGWELARRRRLLGRCLWIKFCAAAFLVVGTITAAASLLKG